MEKTECRLQSDCQDCLHDVTVQKRIAKAEKGIDPILWRTAIARTEAKALVEVEERLASGLDDPPLHARPARLIVCERRRAVLTVRRTVTAARNHPSVLTHSVANELTFTPDQHPATKRFLLEAQAAARDVDPTLPISVDIKGRPGYAEQFTYHSFDMIGLNQYFGWYRWVADFSLLEPYLYELRDLYPGKAIVMTEFGAEGRPELADAPPDLKGGYPFQTFHAQRTIDVIDRSPVLSGAIYWTLREFAINPGWQGGAGRRAAQFEPNTLHQKGLITYGGERKPAYYLLRDRFRATPLYP